jgi:hypothetical protein
MTAACTTRYAYLFEPPAGERLTPEDRSRYELAGILCAGCPVLEACATDKTAARSAGFRHGVLYVFGHNGKPVAKSLSGPKRKYPNFRVAVTRTEKLCSKCQIVKPIAEYRIDRARADGHGVYCRHCKDAMTREQQRRRAA